MASTAEVLINGGINWGHGKYRIVLIAQDDSPVGADFYTIQVRTLIDAFIRRASIHRHSLPITTYHFPLMAPIPRQAGACTIQRALIHTHLSILSLPPTSHASNQ